jgi:hypothetical protein
VKQLAHEPTPASGFVTVTLLVPVLAFDASVTFAVSEVAETNVVEFTVIPVPEKVAAAPLTKFVPVTVMSWLAAPCPRDEGFVEETVGPAFTVKQLAHEPFPASGFVTVTLLVPVVALEETVMLAVREVEETNVVEFTVIPVPEKDAAAPLTNPVPVIVIDWLDAPWPRELGLVDETVGAALTVKQLEHEPVWVSGFVIVTLLVPVVAFEATVTFAVMEVEETNVVEFTVIPVPENEALAPLTKFVPVIVIDWFVAPWPRELGLVEVTVGRRGPSRQSSWRSRCRLRSSGSA